MSLRDIASTASICLVDRRAEWKSESWAFNQPCRECGLSRHEHDPHSIRHVYSTPGVDPEDVDLQPEPWHYDNPAFWAFVRDTTAGPAHRALTRHLEAEANGEYDAPLPSPQERKRIRKALGMTQVDLADELANQLDDRLNVERTLISRWETPAGYVNGKRLNGREPAGELRQKYSDLLWALSMDETRRT